MCISGGHQMSVPVWGGGPKVNTFEEISNDRHQMSLAGGEGLGVLCLDFWGWGSHVCCPGGKGRGEWSEVGGDGRPVQ